VLLRQYLVLKENVRLAQTMRRIAWTDSLTGVYTRHFFNEMLPREMERAQRYHHSSRCCCWISTDLKNITTPTGI
jgi:GGDEF domain-containing protein